MGCKYDWITWYQAHKGLPIQHNSVEKCLGRVAKKAAELKASAHMPRIDCGLAGGKWEKIETIITGQLSEKDIAVYVYDSG